MNDFILNSIANFMLVLKSCSAFHFSQRVADALELRNNEFLVAKKYGFKVKRSV